MLVALSAARGVRFRQDVVAGLARRLARTGAWWRRWAASGGLAHRVVHWGRSRARS